MREHTEYGPQHEDDTDAQLEEIVPDELKGQAHDESDEGEDDVDAGPDDEGEQKTRPILPGSVDEATTDHKANDRGGNVEIFGPNSHSILCIIIKPCFIRAGHSEARVNTCEGSFFLMILHAMQCLVE